MKIAIDWDVWIHSVVTLIPLVEVTSWGVKEPPQGEEIGLEALIQLEGGILYEALIQLEGEIL
jgi:hypothetical protein